MNLPYNTDEYHTKQSETKKTRQKRIEENDSKNLISIEMTRKRLNIPEMDILDLNRNKSRDTKTSNDNDYVPKK